MINERRLKRYCCEDLSLIENYDKAINDNTQTWQIHHRLEDLGFTYKDLKYLNLYWKVPSDELIFMTKSDHFSHHRRGKKAWNSGKTGVYSEETRRKMGADKKDKKLSDETKRKISEANSGEKNGFYGKHHTAESRKKNSEANSGENNPNYIKVCPLKIAYLYNIKKLSAKKIAKIIGVGTGKVLLVLKENNIKRRTPKGNTNVRNRIWITNGNSTKMIYKEDLDLYLEKGFVIGRKKVEN